MTLPLPPLAWHPDPILEAAAAQLPTDARDDEATGPDLVLPLDPLGARAGALLRAGVLEAAGGLPGPDRDLASLAAARVIGCAYTAHHHAEALARATGDAETAARVLSEGSAATLSSRQQAIVTFASRLSATPPVANQDDILALQTAGLSSQEIMDLVNVTALAAASARLALALGTAG